MSFYNDTEGINKTMEEVKAVDVGPITWDDATWILTSSFIIFTMQSGKFTKGFEFLRAYKYL